MEKSWFASLKYIVPSDMEYFLEEKAAEGYMLQKIGSLGFFYFEFVEEMSQKCKYVVDITSLPKSMYVETVMEKGWELMGKTGNCYVWRKRYTEKRPEDFADLPAKRRHCVRLGIGMLLVSLLFVATIAALLWGIYYEHRQGAATHTAAYIVESVINLPFALYFGFLAKKLFSYKEEGRSRKKVSPAEAEPEELDFVKKREEM